MALLDEGAHVGAWRVVRYIDEGGNGEVWEVADADGRPAALKILRDRRADSVAYGRFRREVETVRGLGQRPGVLPILDAHLPEQPSRRDRAWYVMPLARPLAEALDGRPVREVVEAVRALADVLADLHAHGIGHRDLKPANLYLYEGRPALGDFGLVDLPDAESLTEPGRVPGAFGYIADEVMQDPAGAEAPPADVFAIAKVLWKLLTPGALFPPQGALRADGGAATLQRSLTDPRGSVLDQVLEAGTRPAPARLSMDGFAAELGAWLELPEPAPIDDEALLERLAAARAAMASTVAERDLASAREREFEQARDALREASAGLLEVVRGIDPTGADIGPLAIGSLFRLVEVPEETGRPLYGPAFHHGARVTRHDGFGSEEVLVVSFCLQVSEEGEVAVTGLLLEGDEHSNAATFRPLDTRTARLGVEARAAIEATVAEAAGHFPGVLEAFARRAGR